MPATVVCFISEKGGVGKTTSVYHIGIGLRRWYHKRVLTIDADYQRGGLTGRFFPERLEQFKSALPTETTLFHAFQTLYSGQSTIPAPAILSSSYGVHVIPSDPRLASVSTDKLPSTSNIRDNNLMLFTHLSVIAKVLEPLIDDYDYVLIDTHPETSELLRSVIYASDYAVSPVKLDELSSVGVPSAVESVNRVNADVESLQRLLGVASNYQSAVYAGAIGMMAREYGGDLKYSEQEQYARLRHTGGIFQSWVTEGDGLRQAAAQHIPVFDVSSANAQKQTGQFRDIVKEFLTKCP